MTRRLLDYGDDLNDVLRSALDAEKSSPVDPDAARLAKIGAGIADRIGAPPPQPPTNPPPGHGAPVAPIASSGIAAKAPFVLLAAATIAGLFAIGSMGNERPSPVAAPQVKTVETVAPVAEPPPSAPGVSLNDLPSVAPKTATTTTTPKTTPRPAEAPTQEEIALIGRAHDALRADPQGALALCKEHETKFTSGHFAQEREAVAIEALVYLNRKDEAKRRFADFDNKYPSSSHRVHLESLLAR